MELRTLAVTLALAAGVRGGQVDKGPVQELTVCVAGDMAPQVLPFAQGFAARMFGDIGVRLSWSHRPATCEDRRQPAILIRFTGAPANGLSKNAFAYARPREGTVVIVYTRLRWAERKPALAPRLLAHVLVHEIAHTLQRAERHSATGIMKTEWTEADYDRMAFKPLEFEPQDILLIRSGLAARSR